MALVILQFVRHVGISDAIIAKEYLKSYNTVKGNDILVTIKDQVVFLINLL